MRAANDLEALNDLWGEFLTEQHRVYSRLRKSIEVVNKAWADNLASEQKTDPLLRYLLHARNAQEHGLEKISHAVGAGVAIVQGKNELSIRDVRLDGAPVPFSISGPSGPDIKLHKLPADVILVEVRDRGQRYVPPHFEDGPVGGIGPIGAAERCLEYLEGKVGEARALLNLC